MKIAKRVNVQNVRKARRQTKILTEASKHVPRIALYRLRERPVGINIAKRDTYVKERCSKIDSIRRNHGCNQRTDGRREERHDDLLRRLVLEIIGNVLTKQ